MGLAISIKNLKKSYNDGATSVFSKFNLDIKEKKITLPLIHALEKATSSKKRHILGIVKNNK